MDDDQGNDVDDDIAVTEFENADVGDDENNGIENKDNAISDHIDNETDTSFINDMNMMLLLVVMVMTVFLMMIAVVTMVTMN